MKVLQKPVFIGIGIFLAGILLTGAISRYYISKTNEISQNVIDTQKESMENLKEILDAQEKAYDLQPETHLENSDVRDTEQIQDDAVEEAFALKPPIVGDVLVAYTGDKLVYSPILEDYRAHIGIDIYGAVGETVHACEKGEVQAVFEDTKYGKTVKISHDKGYISVYSNLEQNVLVQTGDTVEQGTVIGCVGETALIEDHSNPHLHFELFKDGEAVNPEAHISF